SQLSDRLTMSYGVLLIGGASLLALLYTGGDVTHLVVLYSINVFLTFSLSELAMCRLWVRERKKHSTWRKHISVHVVGVNLWLFPGYFKNFVFVSVGVIDSASFVNVEAVDEVRDRTAADLRRYVELATGLGLAADARMAVGTEAVATAADLCGRIAREFPRSL